MPSEAALTEVPEHLLQRSKAARARLSGAPAPDDSAPSAETAPAKTESAAPAVAAAAAVPEPVVEEPKAPWVEANVSRPKIPVWALSVLVCLPIWAVVYATTNDKPTVEETGALAIGDEVYGVSCSGCHGAAGGGGSGPQLSGGAVLETFPEPGEQVRWVLLGSAGYEEEGSTTYGAQDKPIVGGMPTHAEMSSEELLAVIRHERETLSQEELDHDAWEAAVEALLADPNPVVAEKATEFEEVLASWDH